MKFSKIIQVTSHREFHQFWQTYHVGYCAKSVFVELLLYEIFTFTEFIWYHNVSSDFKILV